jgi:spore germination cell wall hydrolase CwlJ-like protein
MSGISRLKKILTWANLSIAVLAITVASPTASGSEDRAFGFKIAKVQQQQTKVLERQLACLARNVFYEANGESMQGQMAVAQVTVNRARSGLFPNDLCAVVTQITIVGSDTRVCQFSWYCDDQFNKKKIINKNDPSYIAARRVLLDGERVAKIDKDVFFFRRYDVHMHPSWPNKTIAKIGNHVFYKREK